MTRDRKARRRCSAGFPLRRLLFDRGRRAACIPHRAMGDQDPKAALHANWRAPDRGLPSHAGVCCRGDLLCNRLCADELSNDSDAAPGGQCRKARNVGERHNNLVACRCDVFAILLHRTYYRQAWGIPGVVARCSILRHDDISRRERFRILELLAGACDAWAWLDFLFIGGTSFVARVAEPEEGGEFRGWPIW